MRHLKYFENNNDIQIGDYAVYRPNVNIINSENDIKKLIEFINNKIGIVVKCDDTVTIQYHDIPDNIKYLFAGENSNKLCALKNEIPYFGKTAEDVETQISRNKYNL